MYVVFLVSSSWRFKSTKEPIAELDRKHTESTERTRFPQIRVRVGKRCCRCTTIYDTYKTLHLERNRLAEVINQPYD